MRLKGVIATILGVAVGMTAACGGQRTTGDEPAYVRIPKSQLDRGLALEAGFVEDHLRDDEYVFGYVPRDRLDLLAGVELVELPEGWIHYPFDPKTLRFEPSAESPAAIQESYHNYEQLTAALEALARAHPELATLHSAGKSVQGRELWYMRLASRRSATEGRPKLIYIANMHGDEVVGRELNLYLIRKLVSEYGSSPRASALLDHGEVFIMPSMNPDGFERRARSNSNFKDLNRNFPDFTSDPRDTQSGREVETRAIMRLHDEHHFLMALNYHGGAVCFNMPWDTKANSRADERFGDDTLMRELAREYANANGPMSRNTSGSFDRGVTYGYEWYEVDGGMQDWANYYRQSIHATIELSNVKWPSASTLSGFWRDNEESMLRYLERGLIGAHLLIKDAASGQALTGATVTVVTDRRQVVYQGPHVHRPLPAGRHRVEVRVAGYETAVLAVEAGVFQGEYQEVELAPKSVL